MCLMPYAYNKGADQPAQAVLNVTWLKILEDTFLRDVAHMSCLISGCTLCSCLSVP